MENDKYYINFYTLINKLGQEVIKNDSGGVKVLDKDLLDLTLRKGSNISYDRYILKIFNMFIDNYNYDIKDGSRLNNNLYIKITKIPLNQKILNKEENNLKLMENSKAITENYSYKGIKILKLTNMHSYPLELFGYGINFREYITMPDIYKWGLSRIFPKERVDSEKILSEMNLKSFSPNLIYKETKFRYFNDDFSIEGWNF